MTLSVYDILSHLIPGSLVYLSFLYMLGVSFEIIPTVLASAIAYILGYVVNAISSWLEDLLYWSWGGKPSSRLLEGQSIWKVKMFEGSKAKAMLLKESGKEQATNDELFQIAMRSVDMTAETRVADFNSTYAFSRNILGAIFFASAFVVSTNPGPMPFGTALVVLFVVWLRTKQRGYYFAREVLLQYLTSKRKKK